MAKGKFLEFCKIKESTAAAPATPALPFSGVAPGTMPTGNRDSYNTFNASNREEEEQIRQQAITGMNSVERFIRLQAAKPGKEGVTKIFDNFIGALRMQGYNF